MTTEKDGHLICLVGLANGPQRATAQRVLVPQRLWQRLSYYASSVRTEISGFGSLDDTANGLLVTGVFLLPVKVSSGAALIEAETIGEFLYELIRDGRDPSRLRFHWHSHGEFPVSWSQRDEDTIEELVGMSGSLVSLVMNRRGDHLCRYDVRSPIRQRVSMPVYVMLDAPPEPMLRGWSDEVRAKVTYAPQLDSESEVYS